MKVDLEDYYELIKTMQDIKFICDRAIAGQRTCGTEIGKKDIEAVLEKLKGIV
ncbi:hypothetical protein [Oceanobacillus oncorhynchi]|uniref:hypothetical protein n=1 Tax=Oceanobacillus oncorhynchi TaxID=545501 RepID=UPI002F96566B